MPQSLADFKAYNATMDIPGPSMDFLSHDQFRRICDSVADHNGKRKTTKWHCQEWIEMAKETIRNGGEPPKDVGTAANRYHQTPSERASFKLDIKAHFRIDGEDNLWRSSTATGKPEVRIIAKERAYEMLCKAHVQGGVHKSRDDTFLALKIQGNEGAASKSQVALFIKECQHPSCCKNVRDGAKRKTKRDNDSDDGQDDEPRSKRVRTQAPALNPSSPAPRRGMTPSPIQQLQRMVAPPQAQGSYQMAPPPHAWSSNQMVNSPNRGNFPEVVLPDPFREFTTILDEEPEEGMEEISAMALLDPGMALATSLEDAEFLEALRRMGDELVERIQNDGYSGNNSGWYGYGQQHVPSASNQPQSISFGYNSFDSVQPRIEEQGTPNPVPDQQTQHQPVSNSSWCPPNNELCFTTRYPAPAVMSDALPYSASYLNYNGLHAVQPRVEEQSVPNRVPHHQLQYQSVLDGRQYPLNDVQDFSVPDSALATMSAAPIYAAPSPGFGLVDDQQQNVDDEIWSQPWDNLGAMDAPAEQGGFSLN